MNCELGNPIWKLGAPSPKKAQTWYTHIVGTYSSWTGMGAYTWAGMRTYSWGMMKIGWMDIKV
jgi:hypothetical protein